MSAYLPSSVGIPLFFKAAFCTLFPVCGIMLFYLVFVIGTPLTEVCSAFFKCQFFNGFLLIRTQFISSVSVSFSLDFSVNRMYNLIR